LTTEKKSLGIQEIMDLLPHRYPFLMVDRVDDYEISDERKTLRAIKNVSFNEPIFQGHFPAKPVFPGVLILEAMAQGVCPVVSDAGGMKEVVRHGREGYVFARENVPALVTAIRELHADPHRVALLAKAAQHRVVSEFTPERMVERTLDLFERVLAAPAILPLPAAAAL